MGNKIRVGVSHYHSKPNNFSDLAHGNVKDAKHILVLAKNEYDVSVDSFTFDVVHRLKEIGVERSKNVLTMRFELAYMTWGRERYCDRYDRIRKSLSLDGGTWFRSHPRGFFYARRRSSATLYGGFAGQVMERVRLRACHK